MPFRTLGYSLTYPHGTDSEKGEWGCLSLIIPGSSNSFTWGVS